MSQSPRPGVWASCIACLAFAALSTSIALAQQDEQQTSDEATRQSASQGQQQNEEQERQRQEQERQRQQEQQDRQRDEQDNQDEDQDQQDRQRQQQDRQRDQQNRQRDQQDRDRNQQDRQRDDQSWQRDQQDRQRSQQDRDRNVQVNRQDRSRIRTQEQRSRFPQPNRDGQFSRQQSGREGQIGGQERSGRFGQQEGQYGQQQYDVYSERQSRQIGGQDEQDAGLGVNIISEGGEGVTVVRVFQDTPADEMGIQEGDRIIEVNGQQVRSTQEFVSRIRNMNPGDQVQLSVDRDQEQFEVSGQLESREEALARNQQRSSQSWQQEDETWQTGYEQRDQQQLQGRIARGGDQDGRIQQIEQQVNRISQQLDQLRASLRQLRQDQGGQYSRSGERQAGYDEYQGGYQQERFGTRQSGEQWDGQGQRSGRIIEQRGIRSGRIIERGGQFDSGQGSIQTDGFRGRISDESDSSFRSNEGGSDSPGGVTGGLRTRPDNDPNWENR